LPLQHLFVVGEKYYRPCDEPTGRARQTSPS
jgi:hypothetical protein